MKLYAGIGLFFFSAGFFEAGQWLLNGGDSGYVSLSPSHRSHPPKLVVTPATVTGCLPKIPSQYIVISAFTNDRYQLAEASGRLLKRRVNGSNLTRYRDRSPLATE